MELFAVKVGLLAGSKRPKKNQMSVRAVPVRRMLQKLVRSRLQGREEKQGLAEFLGTSESYIKQMIYQGEGGLDAWVSALIYCYDLDIDKLGPFLDNLQTAFRRACPNSESDQLWFSLDNIMTEEEKQYWVQVIRAASQIERDLGLCRKAKGT